MIDRNKVMQALKCCSDLSGKSCAECTYVTDDFCLGNGSPIGQLAHDALELLKEQELKRGRWVRLTGMAPPEYHGHRICSICECFAPYDPLHMGREILPKYCPGCGARMDEND